MSGPGAVTEARRVAFNVVRRSFEQGAFADRALPAEASRAGLDRRDRGQAQRLAYGAIQRAGTSAAFIERLAGRSPEDLDAPVLAALRLGLFEVLFADATPDHAAVDQAVELAKMGGARRGAGLVNAVLRRAAREGGELLASLDDSAPEGAALKHSVPVWLAEMWWRELGPDEARSLLGSVNEPAENAFRVNALRPDPAKIHDRLLTDPGVRRAEGVAPLAPDLALVVDGALGLEVLAALDQGDLVAQARASQAVVDLLDARPGDRVLDLCAGPGIKTSGIAARVGDAGRVVAVEADGGRARQIRELCRRLGAANVRVVEGDASEPDHGAGYDRVLVDPPCSDLGTLAARPDARWRKSPEALERLAAGALRILAAGSRALRPGGRLVYSTCTISRAENEGVVHAALEAHPELRVDDLGAGNPSLAAPADKRFLQTRPDRDRTSGFFIARLRAGEDG
jgi:16S rRNA (cytosine967-C5)-methyltransferase